MQADLGHSDDWARELKDFQQYLVGLITRPQAQIQISQGDMFLMFGPPLCWRRFCTTIIDTMQFSHPNSCLLTVPSSILYWEFLQWGCRSSCMARLSMYPSDSQACSWPKVRFRRNKMVTGNCARTRFEGCVQQAREDQVDCGCSSLSKDAIIQGTIMFD